MDAAWLLNRANIVGAAKRLGENNPALFALMVNAND